MTKRLITDRDVMTGQTSRPIVLDANTLITPSARDRAGRLGIAIVEPGQPSGLVEATPCGCASPDTPCAGAALRDQPDGLWLVRIEGGRIVCALPATGAGQMTRARRGSRP